MKNYFSLFLVAFVILSACHRGGNEAAKNQKPGADSTQAKLETLNKQIEQDGSNAALYNQRAKCYLADHQFDKALTDINKAISQSGGKSAYYTTLSDIYLLMGKPDGSRDALRKAVELNPTDKEALLKLAKLYLIVKDYKNCYTIVKQLLDIDNGNASAYFTRAIGLLEQGDTIHAVSDLMQAVDKNQQYYEAYVQLGELYSIKKDPMAVLYLKNALNIRPHSREALYMLGLFYQESGQFNNAIVTYQALAKFDTAFREAPYNIAYIYLVYLKDFKKAAAYFSESIRKDPAYYQAYFNRGYAYELAGDYKKAFDDYQMSLKIEVNYDKAVEGLNRLDKHMVRK
ncbi:MAG: tetratricopeptide repeat protein [Bacteroidota bacterium]